MFNEPILREGTYLGARENGPVVLLDGETRPTLVPTWDTITFPASTQEDTNEDA